jgi:hypothetical protein
VVPTDAMLGVVQDLIAQDPGSLAPAVNKLRVHLVKAPFTPESVQVPADLVEADFVGATFLEAGAGACQEFFNPGGERCVQLNEPLGGWHWVATVAPSPAQTIYGFYVTDHANAILYGSDIITPTQVVNAVGQGVDIPWIRFTLVPPVLQ